MIKRFVKYYKPNAAMFAFDMFCSLIVAVCNLFLPIVSRNIIDDYIPDKNIRMIFIWLGALVAIYTVKMFAAYLVQYYGHMVGVKMQYQMRNEVFEHMQKLPFSYFDDHKTGTIMSRIINDLMDVSELAHHGPENLFISGILLIGSFVMMARVNVVLTLIIFASMPVLIAFAMWKRIKMARAFSEMREQIGEVNATLENSISGIRVSKAFDNSGYELGHFRENNGKFVEARRKSYKAMAEFSSGSDYIVDLLNVIAIVSSGYCAIRGYITPGEFALFMLFANVFISPIKSLVAFIEQLQSGMTGFERFTQILDTQPEEDADDAEELTDVKGDVVFDNVSFDYGNGQNVLHGVSLHIPAGKTVAFVGPSGGGKTTVCNLIPRFYEIKEGSIKVDGKNIRKLTRSSLRSSIGIVSQDVFLFTGTVYENILYGRPDATREEVIEAAKRANIDEFVTSLPDGYDTFVGERGVKLSGGQKQRISIARVFLKDPPLLILDEATSALDNATEMQIQEALSKLASGRTTLIVAHRLTTIRNADEIIVMDDTGIKERGTHKELLEKSGIYAGLYNAQFRVD
ncbi:MAG: ABC transporter ATP-binding protein [Clostridia bacterium]|nr:ABC transporter ATP-binding protein [Clostridia bacterium]